MWRKLPVSDEQQKRTDHDAERRQHDPDDDPLFEVAAQALKRLLSC